MTEAAAFDVNLALNSMYIIGTITCWACECGSRMLTTE